MRRPRDLFLVSWQRNPKVSGLFLWLAEEMNERSSACTRFCRPQWLVARAAYRLHYWLGLPWRCKIRHTAPVQHDYWNADAGAVEESTLDCGRCDHFFGYSERDPLRSHARLTRGTEGSK